MQYTVKSLDSSVAGMPCFKSVPEYFKLTTASLNQIRIINLALLLQFTKRYYSSVLIPTSSLSSLLKILLARLFDVILFTTIPKTNIAMGIKSE